MDTSNEIRIAISSAIQRALQEINQFPCIIVCDDESYELLSKLFHDEFHFYFPGIQDIKRLCEPRSKKLDISILYILRNIDDQRKHQLRQDLTNPLTTCKLAYILLMTGTKDIHLDGESVTKIKSTTSLNLDLSNVFGRKQDDAISLEKYGPNVRSISTERSNDGHQGTSSLLPQPPITGEARLSPIRRLMIRRRTESSSTSSDASSAQSQGPRENRIASETDPIARLPSPPPFQAEHIVANTSRNIRRASAPDSQPTKSNSSHTDSESCRSKSSNTKSRSHSRTSSMASTTSRMSQPSEYFSMVEEEEGEGDHLLRRRSSPSRRAEVDFNRFGHRSPRRKSISSVSSCDEAKPKLSLVKVPEEDHINDLNQSINSNPPIQVSTTANESHQSDIITKDVCESPEKISPTRRKMNSKSLSHLELNLTLSKAYEPLKTMNTSATCSPSITQNIETSPSRARSHQKENTSARSARSKSRDRRFRQAPLQYPFNLGRPIQIPDAPVDHFITNPTTNHHSNFNDRHQRPIPGMYLPLHLLSPAAPSPVILAALEERTGNSNRFSDKPRFRQARPIPSSPYFQMNV